MVPQAVEPKLVRASGFDVSAATQPAKDLHRSVQTAFQDAMPSSLATAHKSRIGQSDAFVEQRVMPVSARVGTIKPSIFGAVEMATDRSERRAGSIVLDSALEILTKPTPMYTDEARQRKVEGEVSLEALFNADGTVTILRVTHGLGFGLDERAIAAARAVQFKPAFRQGKPVACVASLRIQFQLAY